MFVDLISTHVKAVASNLVIEQGHRHWVDMSVSCTRFVSVKRHALTIGQVHGLVYD